MEQEALLRKLSARAIIHLLVRWAESILKQSQVREAARHSRPQLSLPLDLLGIEMPGAFSFTTDNNDVEFVANYKAVGWQIQSHIAILAKHEVEVRRSREDMERLWRAVESLMTANPKLTLAEALQQLREEESGAA